MNDCVLIIERRDEATAVLTLNRPERRNALSIELMQSLCQALTSLSAEPQLRLVILRGHGSAFCAGLDLREAAETELAEQSAHLVAQTFEAIASSRLLTVGAAQGSAYAGGAGLLACCDFVVAADDLRLGFPEVRRGLVPALVAALLCARLGGPLLREMLLLAEPIDALRALHAGLVHRVVPGGRLMAEAEGLATALLQGAPEAMRQTKRLLAELASVDPGERMSLALEFHKQARRSDEAREGVAAFAEHRAPVWPRPTEPEHKPRGEVP